MFAAAEDMGMLISEIYCHATFSNLQLLLILVAIDATEINHTKMQSSLTLKLGATSVLQSFR